MVKSHTTDKPESFAFDKPETTSLGQTAAAIAAEHGGDSGFLLMDRGRDALSWRTILADAAEQSIDAQYFLWKNDEAGKIMMQRLLAAADRGVRVRVMIDDSMTDSDPGYLALFGAHPNIELRLYKPFGPKHKSLVVRWIDYVADLRKGLDDHRSGRQFTQNSYMYPHRHGKEKIKGTTIAMRQRQKGQHLFSRM